MAWKMHPDPSMDSCIVIPNLGKARIRRARRHLWRKTARHLLVLAIFALLGAGFLLLLPAPIRQAQSGGLPADTFKSSVSVVQLRTSPSPTLIPTRTQTSTPEAPTVTPTSTPILPQMMTATAWQDMVIKADRTAVALQTQYAGNYAASQTALPATVSALAAQLAATADVKTATAQSRQQVQQIKKP